MLLAGAAWALGCTCRGEQDGRAGDACASATACATGLACVEGTCTATPPPAPKPLSEQRIRDCKTLIRVINSETASYGRHQPETPVELLRMADAIKRSAKRIGAVELSDTELAGLRDDYRKMTEELAKAARDAGTAGTDSDKLKAALETMDTIGARESRLLGKLNRHCGIG